MLEQCKLCGMVSSSVPGPGGTIDSVRIGSRVRYVENSREDIGTVVDIVLCNEAPFVVRWDASKHDDETVDRFCASQLALVTY